MMNLYNYYEKERKRILEWLMRLRENMETGHFKFCIKGNLAKTSGKTGLGFSTYAMKILYQIGALGQWDPVDLSEWKEFIKSFQNNSHPKFPGYFVDEVALRQAFRYSLGRYLIRLGVKDIMTQNERFIRAETRQAISTLIMVNSIPQFPVENLPSTVDDFVLWLKKLPWSNPWAAGSHVSHALFFYWYNGNYFNKPTNWLDFIEGGFKFLDSIRAKDGAWYRGIVSQQNKINGAMKILTAYAWCKRNVKHPETLIDLTLGTESWGDGCSIQNNLFVLQQASRNCHHRKNEIINKARETLRNIELYKKSDGGYSFYRDKTQTVYYGYPVSMGFNESDLHGTMMFTWVIATCLELLGIAKEVGWVPQKP